MDVAIRQVLPTPSTDKHQPKYRHHKASPFLIYLVPDFLLTHTTVVVAAVVIVAITAAHTK